MSYRVISGLTASLNLGISTADYFETQVITLSPCLEYTLKGPAIFYVEYELKLAQYKSGSHHKFGFGIDIKAF
jgi:hypothetical protein